MSKLDLALAYLYDVVRPRANEIDTDSEALGEVLQGMFDRDLMALRVSSDLGGGGLTEIEFRTFQEECARCSGTLAFLQTQHQSAAGLIAKGDAPDLARQIIPLMSNGRRRLGIGFSQLRRKGPPMMRAIEVDGGYQLDGTVPWVTGFGFYDEFLIGAALPDGRAVFAIVPLIGKEGVRVSPPMELCGTGAGRTVEVYFDGFPANAECVVMVRGHDFIPKNDMINIALQGQFAIGCALAGVDVVREMGEKRGLSFATQAASELLVEVEQCRDEMHNSDGTHPEERLRIRSWAIDLAVRCAHAAITASSGAANYMSSPAQRIYREALVFTVSAQTTDVMEATLRRLVGHRSH